MLRFYSPRQAVCAFPSASVLARSPACSSFYSFSVFSFHLFFHTASVSSCFCLLWLVLEAPRKFRADLVAMPHRSRNWRASRSSNDPTVVHGPHYLMKRELSVFECVSSLNLHDEVSQRAQSSAPCGRNFRVIDIIPGEDYKCRESMHDLFIQP